MAATDHLATILAKLQAYEQANRPLAIDEPANDFEKLVNDWHEHQKLLEEVKAAIKRLTEDEKLKRDVIADSLRAFFGEALAEGVNDYRLSNSRKLKLTHGIDRKVEVSEIALARAAYEQVADALKDPPFDSLLRQKFELEIKPFRALIGEPLQAFSRAITSKPKAATLEVD